MPFGDGGDALGLVHRQDVIVLKKDKGDTLRETGSGRERSVDMGVI